MVLPIHTFLFADLCDYTASTWRHGDQWSAEVAVEFQSLVRMLAAEECCDVVRSSGDGVMVHAADPAQAVRLARRIHTSSVALGLPDVHVGVDAGPAVALAGDWYGTTVNTAARLTDAAGPGELLISERARAAAGEHDNIGPLVPSRQALKGLPECPAYAAHEEPVLALTR